MISFMSIAADAANTAGANQFEHYGPEHVVDWFFVVVVVGLIAITALLSVLISWALQRYCERWRLVWRSSLAATIPVVTLFSCVIFGLALTEDFSVGGAIREVIGMDFLGYLYFYSMFVLCWLSAFAIGWRLQRTSMKSDQDDLKVFN